MLPSLLLPLALAGTTVDTFEVPRATVLRVDDATLVVADHLLVGGTWDEHGVLRDLQVVALLGPDAWVRLGAEERPVFPLKVVLEADRTAIERLTMAAGPGDTLRDLVTTRGPSGYPILLDLEHYDVTAIVTPQVGR